MRIVVHLSDLHFGRIEPGVLEPLRRKVTSLEPNLVVVSGDLTQRARASQFRAARAFLDTLPKPQIVVPGNHDVPLYNVVMRFAAPLRNFTRLVNADLQPVFVDDELAVVGVNTARSFVFKGGRINDDQVERARAVMCELPERVTKVLVTHHPFDVPKGSEEADQIVGRARMALERLARCGADVLLSGHLHETYVGRAAERFDIEGLAALVVQAGTATSSRTRESVNSFNVLRLWPGRVEVERQVWEDNDFRPDSVDAFDRVEGHWRPAAGRS